MAPSPYVSVVIYNFNNVFPGIPAPAAVSRNCVDKFYSNNKPCVYPTVVDTQVYVQVLYSSNLYASPVYNYDPTPLQIAPNIFSYLETLMGIPTNQQLLFYYNGNGNNDWPIYYLAPTNTWGGRTYEGGNGYWSQAENNILNVKTIAGNEKPTATTKYLNVSVSPEYVYPPVGSTNVPQVTFTLVQPGTGPLEYFPVGVYDLKILLFVDGSYQTLYSKGFTSNQQQINLVVPSQPQYTTFDFGTTVNVFPVELTHANAEDFIYIFNVINNINVTIPFGTITPDIVSAPNVSQQYTLFIPPEPVQPITQFPAGTYYIEFSNVEYGGQVLQTTVTLPNVNQSAPADFLLIENITLTDAFSNYSLTGYYVGPTTEAAFLIINNVYVNCFLKGTKILCGIATDGEAEIKEAYLNIEDIQPGTLVKTYQHGYKPVKYNIHSNIYNDKHNFSRHKLYVYKMEDNPSLTEDLVVTGGHPVLVDQLSPEEITETLKLWDNIKTIGDKYRLLTFFNKNAKVFDRNGRFTVYDLVLENDDLEANYGIYANGMLTESIEEQYFIDSTSLKETTFKD
jgi:hypothetical protein